MPDETPAETVEFFGEHFAVAEKIGRLPLMRFAKAARSGLDTADMDGLAAAYDMLEQSIAPHDWARFEQTADAHRADDDELMAVIARVYEIVAERPTTRPSDSSDGPQTTSPRSTSGRSSTVVDRLEAKGRPDLALMVVMADEARTG